jgi:RNA polymerase sigma-70 factor (ECF subfamily)
MTERQLLHAARGGDADAFGRLVEPHQAMLHARCTRMLGSLPDGEDALQDALLRAWRGLCGFDGRSSFRWWLYRITTNVCLDAIARRTTRARLLDDVDAAASGESHPDEITGLGESSATPEARYELREAVELAFAAALQHLLPTQRTVLVLREVLSFSAEEVSESLGTTVPSVNSALYRARKSVAERLPEMSRQATSRSLRDERANEIVQRVVEAFERGDVWAVVAVLAEDATLGRPTSIARDRGRDAITLRGTTFDDVTTLKTREAFGRFGLLERAA